MKVKDCMCRKIIYADENSTIYNLSKLMKENDIGSIPICDNEKRVVGIITDRDIVLRGIAEDKDLNTLKAKDLMTDNVVKLDVNTTTSEASKCMSHNQIRRIPICEDDKIVGILSIGDLARNNDVSTTNVGTTLECICMNFNNKF